VRDVDEIAASGFPVFSRGPSMFGPGKGYAGSIGEPVRIGPVTVQAGDLVVGDSDGVVVVPAAALDTVLAAAEKRVTFEDAAIARLRGGETAFDIFGWKQP
jgi:4-hydroxy-4-methyl-2-oxoglutarate aldolase